MRDDCGAVEQAYARSNRIHIELLSAHILRWYSCSYPQSYRLACALSTIHLSPSAPETARQHGIAILSAEHVFNLDVELSIQRFFSLSPMAMTL
jgi:hypothetical protein